MTMTAGPREHGGAEYQAGDAIQGRWVVRSVCGGRGKSGMGVVYVVDDRLYGGTLAVKTLQPHLVADAKVRELLRAEANLWLAMGRHPNIVALSYVETLQSQIYMFMEYIAPDAAGRNCLTHFLTGKPLDKSTIGKWALGACAALIHMQSRGIKVHRDLKPDNLMIDNMGRLRVTDFGLARVQVPIRLPSTGEQIPGATLIGGIVGTPGYIAPEVIAGEPPAIASDMYAFGLILAQMMTGKPWAPFAAEWRGDVQQYERDTLRIRESSNFPLPSSPFAAVAAKCLEFDPQRRFSTFDEVRAALESVCAAGGIPVRSSRIQASQPQESQELHRIWALSNLGRYQEALQQIRALRANDPDNAALLTHEGDICAELGDIETAIPLLQRACELSPICAHWNNLGKTLRAARRPQEALTAFQRAIDSDATHVNLWASKGNCLYDLERFPDALQAYEHAARLDRYYFSAQLGRARSLARLDRIVDALAAVEVALDLEPENGAAQSLQAESQNRLQADGHEQACRQALLQLPSLYAAQQYQQCLTITREARYRLGANGDRWNDEGVFLTDLGDYRAALPCFDSALHENPARCDAWTNKGRVYRRMNKVQEALYCHDRAAVIAPQEPIPWFNKYSCYKELGLAEQARESFHKACAVAKTPEHRRMCSQENPDWYYLSLGVMAYNSKDPAEAYRCAASVSPNSPSHAEAKLLMARSRFHLAMRLVEQDLRGSCLDYVVAARALRQSADEMINDEERGVVLGQLDIVCRQYLDAAYPRLVQSSFREPAWSLLVLVVQYCRDEELLKWARRELSVLLANDAIDHANRAALLRNQLGPGLN